MIVYEPKGTADTKTTVYFDGKIVAELNDYFNNGNAEKEPIKDIHIFQIQGFNSFQGALYLDDLFITVEK